MWYRKALKAAKDPQIKSLYLVTTPSQSKTNEISTEDSI